MNLRDATNEIDPAKMKVGDVVLYNLTPCIITAGSYYSNGRLSNSWEWREIMPDGRLGERQSGYCNAVGNQGKFTECPIKFEVLYLAVRED